MGKQKRRLHRIDLVWVSEPLRAGKRLTPITCLAALCLILGSCGGTEAGTVRYEDALQAATGLDGFRQDLIAAELAKAECMAEFGFEYEPRMPSSDLVEGDYPRSLYLESPEAVTDGYGVVASYRRGLLLAETGSDLSELQQEMPAEDFQAFVRALVGEDGTGGCEARAAEAVPMRIVRSEYVEAATALETLVLADPRWIDATADWSECMSAAGYAFSNMDEARFHPANRLVELGPPSELTTDDATLARLAEIEDEERAIAHQDALCQQEQADVLSSVWEEYVGNFLAENPRLVDQLTQQQ